MRMAGNGWVLALTSAWLLACGSDEEDRPNSGEAPSSEQGQDAAAYMVHADAGSAGSVDGAADAQRGDATGDEFASCASVSTGVELEPVHLAFAFDVSGSMGSGRQAWYDKRLKWDPVVRATRTFFAAPSSAGITASLTFFPSDADEDAICEASEYTQPEVGMTPLPSASFGAAIDAVTPQTQADWRSGTPTVAVMRGSHTFVAGYRQQNPGRFAIVLVTDGYPQSCRGFDSVDAVVTEAVSALGEEIPTYVIGVANPPLEGAPDTVSDLHRIAQAGGTERAFLIDTGNPDATASALSGAIAQIRESSVSCAIAIPPSNGTPFDKRNVAVHYKSGANTTDLGYDSTCTRSHAWHYDNADDPREIVLCPSTCEAVRATPDAELEVEFACRQVVLI